MKPITLLSLMLLAVGANAGGIFPTEPIGSSVWTVGKSYVVSWREDNITAEPALTELNNLTIELMNGTDQQQTTVDLIAKGVKGEALKAPAYTVAAKIVPGQYFVRFNQDTHFYWSTRFNIVGTDGAIPTTTAVNVTTSSAAAPSTVVASTTPAVTTASPKATPSTSAKAAAGTTSSGAASSSSSSSTTTPSPQSGDAMGLLPSSLMSLAMGGAALILTNLY